jgi:carbon storage regulator
MLVLSRKKDESIVINNDITIVVVEIRGDKVRLGVEAPKEVPVHRREVYEAIARGEPLVESGPAAARTAVGGDDRRGAGDAGVADSITGSERTGSERTGSERAGSDQTGVGPAEPAVEA